MSAKHKCKYSIKMIPLVLSLKHSSASNEEFEQKLSEFFTFSDDPAQDLAQIREFVERASASDNLVASTSPFDEIEQKRMGEAKTVVYDGTARSIYGEDSDGYNSMKHSFISRIVESVIFDPKSNTWFDPEKEVDGTGYTHLDVAIFNYKKSLIKTIRAGLKLSPIELDITSPSINNELTEAVKDTIIAYQNVPANLIDSNIQQAYVILSNFNDLLKEHTPFIEIKSISTDSQVVDGYRYTGPMANLQKSWSNEDKVVSAKEQYSNLAKILLGYFQEFNNGKFIPDTSIGVDGFIAALKTMRLAILYSNNVNLQEAKAEYYKGDKMDMAKVIDAYLTEVRAGHLGRGHSTNLEYKLQGIVESIYKNPQIPENIRSMFTRMFFETVAQKYRTLGTFNGEFKASNLEDNWIRNQNYNLQEAINGKILGFKENPEAYEVLKRTYGIELSDDSGPTSGDIKMNFTEGGRPVSVTIHYAYNTSRRIFEFKLTEGTTYDGMMADRLIYDLTGYLVGPEYKSYTRNLNGENNTALNDFAGAIGITILSSIRSGNVQPFVAHGILDTREGVVLFHKGFLFNQLDTPAKIASLVAGSETANTVKDVNGHNLPTNGLTSLVHETDEFIVRHRNNGIFKDNLVAANPGLVGAPIIQEGITINGRGKKNKSLTVRELYEFGIIFNFLNELSSGTIYMQPTVNADKTKVLTLPFAIAANLNLPTGGQINLQTILSDIADGRGRFGRAGYSQIDTIDRVLMDLRNARYATIELDLVDKYNEVLNPAIKFVTLEDVDHYLAENHIKYNDLRKMFRDRPDKIEFVEEHTATKLKNGDARINETLLNKIKTFNGDISEGSRFQKRIDRSKRRFAYDLISDGFKLNPYTTKGGRLAFNHLRKATGGESWYDATSHNIIFAKIEKDGKTINITKENADLLLDPSYKASINPIFESYFYANAILCDEYNVISIGEDYSHANKNKSGDPSKVDFDESEWEEFSEASRWVSSVKRNVIPGASLHPLLQYKFDGVAESIKVAAMSDISAATFAIFGVKKDDNDSMDGSGIGNIWEILLEKNSLIDASPSGYDLKTIGWDLDEYGIPMMLKWAVYGITNERRRKGFLSKANVENLYRRMNNIRFDKHIAMNEYFHKFCPNGFYFKNPETQQRLYVSDVIGINRVVTDALGNERNKLVYYRVAQTENGETVYLDKNNKVYTDYNEISTENLDVNTIYDLDMFFGGAWAEVEENGRWKALDLNYAAVLDIICSENLKDYFIAYAVNKSAMKVGVRNLNGKEAWVDGELDYFTMSTKHIGIQMNAEHELDFAEVTEMTQMISALAENWYAGDIVEQIYKDIGAVVEESLASIKIKIDTNDKDGLRLQFGKALIESFDQKEDTIGLAQAFLNKARAALKDGEKPNIPFSAATINGAFIADVASRLTKKGIRRKYSGIAAVLSPSYNMISYFRYTDDSDPANPIQLTKTAESMPTIIRQELARRGLNNFNTTSIWELCNSALVKDDSYDPTLDNKVLNPFLTPIGNSYDIRQGDTIVIAEEVPGPEGSMTVNYTTKVVESWDDYEQYVNQQHPNVIGRLKYAPRDLQGSDIRMTYEGQEYSIYNFVTVRALHALNSGDNTLAIQVLQDPYWWRREAVVKDVDGNINFKESLQNIIQLQLEDLEKRNSVHDLLFGTKRVRVENINTEAAECIMGKSFAQQFGLVEGDDISNILNQGWQFFFNRFVGNYGIPDVPFGDAFLYTKDGPIIVKFGDILNPEQLGLTRNFKIRTVDDTLMLNDVELCSTDGAQTYSYIKDGTTYNVITINNKERFQELLDSELVEAHRFFITNKNVKACMDFGGQEMENVWAKATINGSESPEELVTKLVYSLETEFKKQLTKLSKQRFYAFKASLNIVGARIPTQAMQSFMPMRVVAFTNSTTNDIYVPRTQLWLQGSKQ